jgi:hypothetical protein
MSEKKAARIEEKLIEAVATLSMVMPFLEEDYYPDCATPEFKAAMTEARRVMARYAPSALSAASVEQSMNKNYLFYGLRDDERLEMDPDMVVERVLENAVESVGEGNDAVFARIEWPIQVHVFRRMDIGGERYAQEIATNAIESVLESLDETYFDPDGYGRTSPTEGMKAAALAFGRAVVADYVPFACEPTGEVIEYTREQVERGERRRDER